MDQNGKIAQKQGDVVITTQDILFECPSCGKGIVIDQAAEGLMVECPQCQVSIIVPPKQASSTSTLGSALAPPSSLTGQDGIAALSERLAVLGNQLKELQTQRVELNGRIMARMTEANRDLVLLSRMEASQQQILTEWTQITHQIAEASRNIAAKAAGQSGHDGNSGRTRVAFRA